MEFVPWRKQEAISAKFDADSSFPNFFKEILSARGFYDEEESNNFIDAVPVLHNPFLLNDMDRAVERIRRALAEGDKVLVYGDYDCDGVTATVMLYDYLENAGADVLYYIPQREVEGYGLNLDAVNRIHEAEVKLIITVDNGVSSIDEIALAVSLGIDVIVTDHHRPKEQLPVCTAVIDPHRADCEYPFKELCGAGVVYKLIMALENDTEGMVLELYGDLLAVATMADIVPLVDENRYLVKVGIGVLANTQRPGLAALAAVSGITLEEITAEKISFGLAPRINVTGRIGSVDSAVELLLTEDEAEAKVLAETINNLNTKRKEIEADIVAGIGKKIVEKPELTAARVLVVEGENWNPGVIGITAARLVERYRKPCIIFTHMKGGELRGSARSVEGFSIIEAIAACGEYLIKYGGHPMAAGLSVSEEKFDAFVNALEQYSAVHYPIMPRCLLTVDSDIMPGDVTMENIQLLERLQPYGCGNPQPVPVLRNVTITGITPMGGGNHLRLTLSSGSIGVEAAYFSMTQENFPLPLGTAVDCAVSLSVNVWQGKTKPSVRVVSIVPVGFPMESRLHGQELYDRLRRNEIIDKNDSEQCIFGRSDLSVIFRLLREKSPYCGGADWLLHLLGESYGGFRVMAGIEILSELGLIKIQRQKSAVMYTMVPSIGKMNISDAPTYKKLAAMKLVRQE